jgi:tetratricopeptide (TPR) repeat protein
MKNVVDTVIIYNAGRTAVENKNYSEAVKHFSALDALNYDEPFLYVYLKQALFAAGDTARGAEMINKGFQKYPENQSIMIELINYYLLSNQSGEALKLLNVAKSKDPENVSFVFAEGTLYDRIGDFDNAERVYKECLEMDQDFYDAAYNISVLYYNRAVKIYEQSSLTSDNALFQKLDAEGDSWLRKAIPYMEMASKLDPNDRYSLESLRNMYYRLEMNDKYQEVVKKLQTM